MKANSLGLICESFSQKSKRWFLKSDAINSLNTIKKLTAKEVESKDDYKKKLAFMASQKEVKKPGWAKLGIAALLFPEGNTIDLYLLKHTLQMAQIKVELEEFHKDQINREKEEEQLERDKEKVKKDELMKKMLSEAEQIRANKNLKTKTDL